ncbi:MAG TPA: UDP-N-acetylglucosamine pyrophosphorylase [Eubacterium sp.]|jgi:UDP-N-acetylglucosamine/UDP-N-acetylgalactosamine diphosphorylase|nr:UDP-N-acetylglucosamine pyrophosphorylase [Eubacterium sp.]
MNYNEAMEKLKKYGQEHVLKYYAELPDEQRNTLIEQIDRTDFTVIGQAAETGKRGTIAPIKAMTIPEIDMGRERFERIGMEAVKAGKLGAVLLAGGMGTRLGSDAPKGMYDIGISKPVYIFQRLIENLMKVVEKAGNYIQLFVMTSEKNHDATVGFFKEHDYFGYDKDYIAFFKQDMAPAADFDGKVYMEAKDSIATSPNGNGGWFLSMKKSGLLELVEKRGIEWLNVFAVDNVLQSIADPVFAGAVLEGGYSVGSKVIRKVNPQEKVGVMCTEDGRPSIVEYIELTEDMLTQRDENGEYAYNFGVILNYLFKVDKLVNLLERKLPYHKSAKKIPYINEAGELVKPEEPNGYKYEQFILDMIQMLDSCLPFEVVRGKEFAPIKNKTGVDSVESARELLRKNGIEL